VRVFTSKSTPDCLDPDGKCLGASSARLPLFTLQNNNTTSFETHTWHVCVCAPGNLPPAYPSRLFAVTPSFTTTLFQFLGHISRDVSQSWKQSGSSLLSVRHTKQQKVHSRVRVVQSNAQFYYHSVSVFGTHLQRCVPKLEAKW
jgi:hypothetical protein